MRRVRLARLRADLAPPIAVGDQPAFARAGEIAAFLRQQGAPGLDGFLAQPQLSDGGNEIDWYTSHPGTAVPLSALNRSDREALEERLAVRLAQLNALAEDEATPLEMRQLLSAAAQYPGPDCVFAVGREPVLAMWGHRGSQTLAAPAIAATAPATAATATAAASAAAAGFSWRRWLWLGLLLLLLLAALLAFAYCSRQEEAPVEPPIETPPAAPAVDPDLVKELEQERDRAEELRKQLDTLRGDFADKLAQCPMPDPAPAPEPTVEPAPQPQPQPQPQPETPTVPPEPLKKVEEPEELETPPLPVEEMPVQQAAKEPTEEECEKLAPQRKPWEAPEVVFVVDASGSMEEQVGGETRLEAAKESVSFIADHLPADVDTALVKFRDCNAVDNDYFLDRQALKSKVNQLQSTGGTPLARSIDRAARIISPTKETVIVVVTDGDDTCQQQDPCEVARQAKASHPNLTINVVDVSGQGLGSCIAQNGGGRVLPAKTPLEIQQAIKDATNQVMLPSACTEGN